MKHLKNRLEHHWQENNEMRREQSQQTQHEHDIMEKPALAEVEQCSFDFQQVPQPDVQVPNKQIIACRVYIS